MQVHFNQVDKTGNITVPNTGWWQTWENMVSKTITLESGPQIMTVVRAGNADFNLNKITLTYIGGNGDMDLDGDIDLVDFSKFTLNWKKTNCGNCGGADLTGDGNVGMDDLDSFLDNWMGGR